MFDLPHFAGGLFKLYFYFQTLASFIVDVTSAARTYQCHSEALLSPLLIACFLGPGE